MYAYIYIHRQARSQVEFFIKIWADHGVAWTLERSTHRDPFDRYDYLFSIRLMGQYVTLLLSLVFERIN